MSSSLEVYGAVIRGSSAVLLARVALVDGTTPMHEEIESVHYTVTRRSDCVGQPDTDVTGHTNVTLVPNEVFTSSLQTGTGWTADEVGFNFRHEIDQSTALAFQEGGFKYIVEYAIKPVDFQGFLIRFVIEAI